MIQCSDCEHGRVQKDGLVTMTCHPGKNIKEPECLSKWMLLKLTNIERMWAHSIGATNDLIPLQVKLLQHNCAQIDDLEKGESWKQGSDEDEPAD